jgi:phospholipid/cholesterol/gamma-HCH transport system substrate-binding protein
MSDRGVKATVGTIVILAVAIALVGVIWLGQYGLYREHETVTVRFVDVAGLEKGDGVAVAGVHKGRVVDISLRGREAYVQLLLDRDVWLAEDATFSIKSKSALGEKFVSIDPGSSSVRLALTEPATGRTLSDLSGATEQLGVIASRLGEVIISLEENVLNDEVLGSLRETVENLKAATGSISELTAENRGDLRRAVTGMRGASAELQTAASGLSKLVNTNEPQITDAIGRLSGVAERLDTLTARLENGEGTLGRLLEDDALYVSLQSTADELRTLIQDVKKNPGRYIHLSIF